MLDKKIIGVLCVGLFLTGTVVTTTVTAAEVRFVRPSVEVPVRRGQGTEFKILKLVKDGDRVELLEEGDAWAKILVGEDTEGWIPKRFLSKEAPPVKLVQVLREENEQLKQKNAELDQELKGLKDLQVNTGSELSSCIAERDTVQERYQVLEAETSDVVAIKSKMDATEKEIEEVRSTLTAVQKQNSELKRKSALTWFLAGAGVLLFGWMIGMFTGRSKKRKSSLL